MSANKERIAELYFASGSFNIGQFRISAHQENPNLPLSPYYLHYPKADEPGAALLPEMFSLIGEEFYILRQSQSPVLIPNKIAGVPLGALPLADAHAKHYDSYPSNLLTFTKAKIAGKTVFGGPAGEYKEGDELTIDDDHTSGSRNKKLIKAVAVSGGLAVAYMLTVVDRQQGGVENMAADGVTLLSIFTIEDLLSFAVQGGFASIAEADRVREYKAANQLKF